MKTTALPLNTWQAVLANCPTADDHAGTPPSVTVFSMSGPAQTVTGLDSLVLLRSAIDAALGEGEHA